MIRQVTFGVVSICLMEIIVTLRMLWLCVFCVIGVDHAGIATQSVVEKKLKKEQNITRYIHSVSLHYYSSL
jgi:valyl-tRNA synthetase